MNDFLKDGKGRRRLFCGLQSHNSSNGTFMLDKAIRAVKLFGGNLIEVPVYWYMIEREEGAYDCSSVRDLILKAREADLSLIILWFGSSKNSHPNYMPDWAKLDAERFRLSIGSNGAPVMMASPFCAETLAVETKAFKEVMNCIKEIDTGHGTVVAVQVNNEVGLGNTDRDYSETAEAEYQKPVPQALDGLALEDSGCANDGATWRTRFGRHASEAFMAWHFARYNDALAEAGKEIYSLPMTVNAMLGEMGIEEAGYNYNSGAAVGRVLDIWKIGAPHIDLLCPDIYEPRASVYRRICERYTRPDNPLFVPEFSPSGIASAMNMLTAVADYGCIGLAGFGAESTLLSNGELSENAEMAAISMRAIMGLEPLLIKYRGTGKVHAIVQEEFARSQYLKLDHYHITADFTSTAEHPHGVGSTINFRAGENAGILKQRGRVLIVQTGETEFYMAGAGVMVNFIRRPEPDDERAYIHLSSRASNQLNFLTVEEGRFNGDEWVCDYYRNGDESNFGCYVHPGMVVRIRLNPSLGMDLK